MCVECWNTAMAGPAVVVAARFAWRGYGDKLRFRSRRHEAGRTGLAAGPGDTSGIDGGGDRDLVEAGAPPP